MTQEQSITKKIVQIGLFGGLFWGGVWYFLHIFSFTEAGPNYLLLPFAFGTWKEGVWGNVLAIVFIGILSIIVAFLYKATFKNLKAYCQGYYTVSFGGPFYF